MKTNRITTDGPFSPNNHFRAYVKAPGTTAGRRTLDDKSGKPLEFATRADAQLHGESLPAPRPAHRYDVGVSKDGQRSTISIDANNRSQATRKAEKLGYVVRDVNMIG